MLASSNASAISPKTAFAPKPGIRSSDGHVGRFSTEASVSVNCRFVTASAAAFTGPLTESSRAAHANIAAASSAAIQLHHCDPSPTCTPPPSLNGNNICPSAPPAGLRTIPSRTCATRSPASRAGSAAASHSRATPARKSSPGSAVSDRISSPRSPYSPIAEATTSDGRSSRFASASAMTRVLLTRLSRIFRFFSSSQRPMIDSPARCTTASHPSNSDGSSDSAIGSYCRSSTCGPRSCGADRVSRTTS